MRRPIPEPFSQVLPLHGVSLLHRRCIEGPPRSRLASMALTVLGGVSALFILCLLLYAVHWPLHASHSFLAAFLGNFYDVSPEQITVEAHIRGTIGTKGTTHAFSNAEAAFQGLFSSSLDYCSCV